ncbi:MAG: choice-of-anchor D domain-containing protein [Rhodoferax sp.]|nr:choice-of-anchor D domain-containing protein [Rhodoferax sp.]
MLKFRSILSALVACASLLTPLAQAVTCAPNMVASNPDTDYTDHGDGTVTHVPSGLMWKRCAEGQSWSGSTCTGAASGHTWAQALSLGSASSFAAHSDWRLPNQKELHSLVEECRINPAINDAVFPATPSSRFWSGSPNAYGSGVAWFVAFDYGRAGGSSHSNGSAVRLVRGGQYFGSFDSFDTLALSVSKTGAGTVSGGPIHCGSKCSGQAGKVFDVTLAATPAANLLAWGGACSGSAATCTVTMDVAKDVTASFKDSSLVSGLPAALAFATQNMGSTSASKAVSLSNTGTAALNINSISVTGDFVVTHTCGAGMGAGGTCDLSITFKPTASGARTGTLTLDTDAPGSPHTVSLSGNGQGALATLSDTSKTFASQDQGTTSAAQTLTLSNTGGAVLNISSIAVTGDFAKTTTCGTTLAAAANCSISITFSPTTVGALTGSVVITSDASNSPTTVSLSGTGLAVPVVSLNPTTLGLAATAVGSTSTAQSTKLSNTGAAALSLTNISASGDFAVTHNCGSGLSAAGFCNLSVTFTPTVPGLRTGSITIASNAPGSPHTVALTGTGGPATTTTTTTSTTSTTSSTSTTTTSSTTTTTLAGNATLALQPGWNLLGNGQSQPLTVASAFGVAAQVTTVWKWDVLVPGWQFYAPSMDATALQTYAASKGYAVLSTINPGEGFWVNAAQAFTATLPSGSTITGNAFQDGLAYALKPGWNLVSVGNPLTPSAFNAGLSATPPAMGVIPANVTSLWAWDNPQAKWYFYAPSLEGQGGSALFDYTASKGYLDFTATGKTLGNGTGFWVNRP